jgi:hypothetical protein
MDTDRSSSYNNGHRPEQELQQWTQTGAGVTTIEGDRSRGNRNRQERQSNNRDRQEQATQRETDRSRRSNKRDRQEQGQQQ